VKGERSWVEVRVDAPLGWGELVAESLSEEAPRGVAFGPASRGATPPRPGAEVVRAYRPADQLEDGVRERIAARLAGLAAATGAAELSGLSARYHRLPPEDWATSWEKVWRPFRIGRLCVQRPADPPPPRAGDVRIALEPGGVFGSGRHATTRACLAALQQVVAPGDRVLDAGTGTGILAVAAALLGAGSALGFDIDEGSQPAARELALRNGVAERCEFRTGGFEVLGPRDTGFDGVVANLYADLVCSRAAELSARLAPRGWFVVSGIPDSAEAGARRALAAAGLDAAKVLRRGRWLTLAGRGGSGPRRS
jgi:ribosomal protein L11 methyltransferase